MLLKTLLNLGKYSVTFNDTFERFRIQGRKVPIFPGLHLGREAEEGISVLKRPSGGG